MHLFEAALITNGVETKDKFKFPVNRHELLCRAYEMLLKALHRLWTQSVTKPNEKRIKRFFLEYLGMQFHLGPNN